MPDGGGAGAEFTVRLVNQVTAPAKAIQQSMKGVGKAVGDAKRVLEAPTARGKGPTSGFDRALFAAKSSQAGDFARQNAKLIKSQESAAAKLAKRQQLEGRHANSIKNTIQDHHAQHGTGATLAEAGSDAALGATAAIAAAALAAAAAVGYLAVKFVEASVEAAKFAERSTLAIGFLTNDAQQAGNAFDEVRHMAQGLGLEVDHTVEGFQKLLAAQFSVGKSKDLIKMGADMQAIGASAEEVQRIIYAMTEIKSIGSLQKRQERMLQMAGISGELIDKALMKKTGISDKGGLDKARKGNKIGADVAIDAIMEAVMHKTHEAKLGDAGKAFANTTLAGMQQQLAGGLENFFIDVGQKILPGLTTVARLIAGSLGKLADDPQIQALGAFLLNRFELFALWVQANWPQIETTITDALHGVGSAIRFVVDMFDSSTQVGKATELVLYAIGAALGIAALAMVVFMSPLILLIAALGLLAYGIILVAEYLTDVVPKWLHAGEDMVSALINGIMSGVGRVKDAVAEVLSYIPGGSLLIGSDGKDAAAIGGVNAGPTISGALGSMSEGKTEAGKSGGAGAVHIASMPITVPQSDDPQKQASLIGAAVRSELQKVFSPA